MLLSVDYFLCHHKHCTPHLGSKSGSGLFVRVTLPLYAAKACCVGLQRCHAKLFKSFHANLLECCLTYQAWSSAILNYSRSASPFQLACFAMLCHPTLACGLAACLCSAVQTLPHLLSLQLRYANLLKTLPYVLGLQNCHAKLFKS